MAGPEELTLSLIGEHRILDKGAGLNEPSGLTLNTDGTALYTVSDDTKAIFKLDLKGRLRISESFFIGVDDLEAHRPGLFGCEARAEAGRVHDLRRELRGRPCPLERLLRRRLRLRWRRERHKHEPQRLKW